MREATKIVFRSVTTQSRVRDKHSVLSLKSAAVFRTRGYGERRRPWSRPAATVRLQCSAPTPRAVRLSVLSSKAKRSPFLYETHSGFNAHHITQWNNPHSVVGSRSVMNIRPRAGSHDGPIASREDTSVFERPSLGTRAHGPVTHTIGCAPSLHSCLVSLQTAGKERSPALGRGELEKFPRCIEEDDCPPPSAGDAEGRGLRVCV